MSEQYYTKRIQELADEHANEPAMKIAAILIAELAIGLDQLREEVQNLKKARNHPWRFR